MTGHEFLTSIGILHRDISENNIVLGIYPWEKRGYIIDLDMAILQDAKQPTQVSSAEIAKRLSRYPEKTTIQLVQPDGAKHVKGLRTASMIRTLLHGRSLTLSQGYLSIHFVQRAQGQEAYAF